MSISYRPRLNKPQIVKLKADIKFLTNAISKQLADNATNKISPVSAQNAIAKELSFTSFAELTQKEVPTEHHSDFSLTNALTNKQIYTAYSKIKFTNGKAIGISLKPDHVTVAVDKLNEQPKSPDEIYIELLDLYKIINADKYNHGHQYKKGDGYPSDFVVSTKTEFFNQLRSWDHFRVYDGKEYKCFTVEEFEHIYDKSPCFRVVVGRRYENGLSVGDQ